MPGHHLPKSFRLNNSNCSLFGWLFLLTVTICCYIPLMNFSIQSVIVLFSSTISVWFFFLMIYIFLFIFSYIIFLISISFCSLYMLSFCLWSIFKTLVLTSLSCKFNVWASSGMVSLNYFVPMKSHVFLFLCMPVISLLLLKIGPLTILMW